MASDMSEFEKGIIEFLDKNGLTRNSTKKEGIPYTKYWVSCGKINPYPSKISAEFKESFGRESFHLKIGAGLKYILTANNGDYHLVFGYVPNDKYAIKLDDSIKVKNISLNDAFKLMAYSVKNGILPRTTYSTLDIIC